MAASVQQFFQRYLEAMRRHDATALAHCHALPCLLAQPGARRVLTTADDLDAHCRRTMRLTAEAGLVPESFELRAFVALGDAFAFAEVAWRPGAEAPRHDVLHTGYQLARTGGGWAIVSTTAHADFLSDAPDDRAASR